MFNAIKTKLLNCDFMSSAMLKTHLSCLLFLFFQNLLIAQFCLLPDITITSQSQIDNFQALYGPCDRIQTDLTVQDDNDGIDDIIDLDGLSGVTRLAGEIVIKDNNNLFNMDGLSNLEGAIGLTIENNPNLSAISLGKVISFNTLTINSNSSLASINLTQLTQVSGNLTINSNPLLISLSGLSRLLVVLGDLVITNNIQLSECCGLEALFNLGSIYGTTQFSGNTGNFNNNGGDILVCIECDQDNIIRAAN